MSDHHIPGAAVRCCTASAGRLSLCSQLERSSDVNIKRTALALAIGAGVLNPTGTAEAKPRADLVALVNRTFGRDAAWARRIVACESSWNPRATHRNSNGTIDYGLFQLNSGGTLQSLGLTARSALDPVANTRAAYRLFRSRGRSPWVCSGGR